MQPDKPKMKLTVRQMKAHGIKGGAAFMLVDEAGELLPNQHSVNMHQQVGAMSTVTVTFVVDGDLVKIGSPFPLADMLKPDNGGDSA